MHVRRIAFSAAILFGSAPVFADAFFSAGITFTLTFPQTIDACPNNGNRNNCFGLGGPLTAFDPAAPGPGLMGTQTGGYPTWTTTIQASGLATPVNTVTRSKAATMSARLGNLTGSGGPTPSGRFLVFNVGYAYTYTLEALADTAQDAASADIFIRLRMNGFDPANWEDVFDTVISTDKKNGGGNGNIQFVLPANSVTALHVFLGAAGTATSNLPPVIPPPPPPPPEPPYPPDPIPEPSFFAPVGGAIALSVLRRRLNRRTGSQPAG